MNISGFLGEAKLWNCNCTVVQKSHEIKVTGFSGRNIIIIRNPYDSFIAHFNWRHSKTNDAHTGYAPPKLFKSKGKPRHVKAWTMLELTSK